jgi:hypothetical protein
MGAAFGGFMIKCEALAQKNNALSKPIFYREDVKAELIR